DQANVARCRRAGGRERKTNAGTGKGEESEQERRTTIIHASHDRTHLSRVKNQILAEGVRKSQTMQKLGAQTHRGEQARVSRPLLPPVHSSPLRVCASSCCISSPGRSLPHECHRHIPHNLQR